MPYVTIQARSQFINGNLFFPSSFLPVLKERLDRVTKEDDKKEVERMIEEAEGACGYPDWVTKRKKKENNEKEKDHYADRVSIPYTKGF